MYPACGPPRIRVLTVRERRRLPEEIRRQERIRRDAANIGWDGGAPVTRITGQQLVEWNRRRRAQSAMGARLQADADVNWRQYYPPEAHESIPRMQQQAQPPQACPRQPRRRQARPAQAHTLQARPSQARPRQGRPRQACPQQQVTPPPQAQAPAPAPRQSSERRRRSQAEIERQRRIRHDAANIGWEGGCPVTRITGQELVEWNRKRKEMGARGAFPKGYYKENQVMRDQWNAEFEERKAQREPYPGIQLEVTIKPNVKEIVDDIREKYNLPKGERRPTVPQLTGAKERLAGSEFMNKWQEAYKKMNVRARMNQLAEENQDFWKADWNSFYEKCGHKFLPAGAVFRGESLLDDGDESEEELGGTFDAGQGQLGGTFDAGQGQLGGTFDAGQGQLGGTFDAGQGQLGGTFDAGYDETFEDSAEPSIESTFNYGLPTTDITQDFYGLPAGFLCSSPLPLNETY